MFATLLQLFSLLASNVNRLENHRRVGEEDLNWIYVYHLSQRPLLVLFAPTRTSLQPNYRQRRQDCKFNV
jgi:hypothetical protein